ncbi:hypothetical protein [Demequina flava]|uniref:hypothetical protein n=1 Tax=Demequina flava TaxID=1095025 RepID=UPI000783B5EC|nr:hypothetical protein [Demequina flava]
MGSDSPEAIERATSRAWNDWCAILGDAGGETLTHKQLAAVAQSAMPGEVSNPAWWAQGVTVAFERHIGRRLPGQAQDGTFEVSASTTLAVSRDDALELWADSAPTGLVLDGVSIGEATTSATAKWRRWRTSVSDGSRLGVDVGIRGENAVVTATWTGLPDAATRESRRLALKAHLATLAGSTRQNPTRKK